FTPAAEQPSLIEQQEAERAETAAARRPAASEQTVAAATGAVVFTALDEAWVRFYTSEGVLAEMLMAPGDSYTVPAEAEQPMLRTGRPDALQITIGGRRVPRLSEDQRVMSDVPVSAEALRARRGTDPAPAPAASPTT